MGIVCPAARKGATRGGKLIPFCFSCAYLPNRFFACAYPSKLHFFAVTSVT